MAAKKCPTRQILAAIGQKWDRTKIAVTGLCDYENKPHKIFSTTNIKNTYVNYTYIRSSRYLAR